MAEQSPEEKLAALLEERKECLKQLKETLAEYLVVSNELPKTVRKLQPSYKRLKRTSEALEEARIHMSIAIQMHEAAYSWHKSLTKQYSLQLKAKQIVTKIQIDITEMEDDSDIDECSKWLLIILFSFDSFMKAEYFGFLWITLT